MQHTLIALALVLTVAAGASAQTGNTAVAVANTPIYIAPDASRTPLRVAAQGTVFTVVAEEGDWTRIQFKDPQWGVRVGYVATRMLQFRRPDLAPMDLSVPPGEVTPTAPAEPAAPPRAAAPRPQPRPWEVPSPARSFERGFIDVNFGVAWAEEKSYAIEVNGPLFSETRTFRMSHESPRGASFDFGGGFMFTPEFGVGVSFVGTAHQGPVGLFVNVPHPFAFNSHASDTDEADREFQRVEGSANIQFVGAAALGDGVRVRVFAGPTWFRVQQDLVSDITYAQVFNRFTRFNEVEIGSYRYVEKVEATGWGYHVGGDISFFFNRVIGLGGFARYSRGTVEITEPFAGDVVELKAGGFQAGGGLRLKF